LKEKVLGHGFADRLRQGGDISDDSLNTGALGWDVVHLLVDAIVKLEDRIDMLSQRVDSATPGQAPGSSSSTSPPRTQ
jgi:hypothetical protein